MREEGVISGEEKNGRGIKMHPLMFRRPLRFSLDAISANKTAQADARIRLAILHSIE